MDNLITTDNMDVANTTKVLSAVAAAAQQAANTTYTLATAVLPLDENATETLQNAHQALHNALVNLEAYVATHPECARAVKENFTAVFQGACGPSMVMEEHMVTAMLTALGIFVVFMLTCMLR